MENSYTNTALQAIAKALNEGINDIGAVSITITSVIVLIVVLSVIFRLKNRRRIKKSSEASYQKLIRKHNLTILELDLIDKLATSLKKTTDKYLILVKKSTFRQAVNHTENLSNSENEMIENLKPKLGFSEPVEGELRFSTKSLTQGMPVKIKVSDDEYANAEVYSISENNFTIKYPNQKIPVLPDKEISLFTSDFGIFRVFRIIPDKIKEEIFTAPHSIADVLEKMSTRIDVTAEVESIDENEEESNQQLELKATIVFLTQKGAFVFDKHNKLHPEDKLRLYFSNDRKKQFPVFASVTKISQEKKLASVQFTDIQN